MSEVVLATLNARYVHASLGLRYLRANLGELRERCTLQEFVIGQKTEELVERILALQPKVLGLGIYIWNVEESTRLVAQLKVLAPDLQIVLGGPEVSFEIDQQRICALADYVITGWGEVSLPVLLRQLLAGERPVERVIAGIQPPLAALSLPYQEYSDRDLAQRYLYVEASRGCPFKCEFCLSALDRSAWPFELARFLDELESLYARGARRFKFVDRTFNLKIDTALAILGFFRSKLEQAPHDPVFAHFELVPDHLPERLKAAIALFPPGTLQFEIGIQTFDPEVQARISRKQNNARAIENLHWLRTQTQAHLHVDLIAGLPGEDLAGFARGFDQLVSLRPHEIQFGILKRLRGAPIARHTEAYALRFSPDPPYTILASSTLDFPTMQRLVRFARYWDLIANSGRFLRSLPLLLGASPFARFLGCADWLYAQTGQTHALAHERLVSLLERWGRGQTDLDVEAYTEALVADYRASGGRSRLGFEPDATARRTLLPRSASQAPARQARHLRGAG